MTDTSRDGPAPIADPAVPWPLTDLVVAASLLAALAWGWQHRADPALDPQAWPGYLLGLGGGLAMLAVLGFSLRKRARAGRCAHGSPRRPPCGAPRAAETPRHPHD